MGFKDFLDTKGGINFINKNAKMTGCRAGAMCDVCMDELNRIYDDANNQYVRSMVKDKDNIDSAWRLLLVRIVTWNSVGIFL